jgi:hypothetical protein
MQIESFEKACELRGYDPLKCLPDVSNVPERFQPMSIAQTKALIICEAANIGEDGKVWQPNWNDRSERKWTCVYDMEVDGNNPAGFRFDASAFVITGTLAGAGSGLCFRTEEDAIYHFKQHAEIFRALMTFQKR